MDFKKQVTQILLNNKFKSSDYCVYSSLSLMLFDKNESVGAHFHNKYNDKITLNVYSPAQQEYYEFLLHCFCKLKKAVCPSWSEQQMVDILVEKNRKYGNAVLEPLKVFSSNVSVKDVILSRIDEKISRWLNDNKDEDEDILTDIIGYLVFLNIIQS